MVRTANLERSFKIGDLSAEIFDEPERHLDVRPPRFGELQAFEELSTPDAEQVRDRTGVAKGHQRGVDAVLEGGAMLDDMEPEAGQLPFGATGLAIFTLLALGTFTAGVHVLSWQVCLLGLIMALGIPAIAWIENSALILVLIVGVVVGIGIVIWWHFHDSRVGKA